MRSQRGAITACLIILATALAASASAASDGSWTLDGTSPTRVTGAHLSFEAQGALAGHAPALANVTSAGARFFDGIAAPGDAAEVSLHESIAEWTPSGGPRWNATFLDAPTPLLSFRLGAGESVTFTLAEGFAIPLAKPLRALGANGDIAWFHVEGASQQDDGRTITFRATDSPARVTVHLVAGESAWSAVARAFPPAFATEARLENGTAVLAWTEDATAAFDAEAERLSLTFPLPTDKALRAVRLVAAPGVFGPVERAEQIVVEVNDRFGVRLKEGELSQVEGGVGPFYTVSPVGDGWEFQLLIQSNGTTRLNLTRDVAPPALVTEPRVENVTHGTLFLYTETSEWSFVDVYLESRLPDAPRKDHNQLHRTTAPSILQTFAIQGLQPERTYTYTVNATDVAGNIARFGPWTFTTLAEPVIPGPRVVALFPEPNATLTTPPLHLSVTLDVSDSPLMQERARLFVDAREVDRERFVVNATGLIYIPEGGFKPGPHRASVELDNENGGHTRVMWTFHVADPAQVAGDRGTPGADVLVALGAIAGAVVAWRRRERNND